MCLVRDKQSVNYVPAAKSKDNVIVKKEENVEKPPEQVAKQPQTPAKKPESGNFVASEEISGDISHTFRHSHALNTKRAEEAKKIGVIDDVSAHKDEKADHAKPSVKADDSPKPELKHDDNEKEFFI